MKSSTMNETIGNNERNEALSLRMHQAGINQEDIMTTCKVLDHLGKSYKSIDSMENTFENEMDHATVSVVTPTPAYTMLVSKLDQSISTMHQHRQPKSQWTLGTANNENPNQVLLQSVYQILQLLPRNVYFFVRPLVVRHSPFPSLYKTFSEHMDISVKDYRHALQRMKCSPRQFPLLHFIRNQVSKAGLLLLIKNDISDVPPSPFSRLAMTAATRNATATTATTTATTPTMNTERERVSMATQEEHPLYKQMKALPRDTYFAIKPSVQPCLLTALEQVTKGNQNTESMKIVEMEEPDKEDDELMKDNMTKEQKSKQKQLRIFLELIQASPRLFPLLHIHSERYKGSRWIMVKKNVNAVILGGPEEEHSPLIQPKRPVVAFNDQDASFFIREEITSFYQDVILKLDPHVYYCVNKTPTSEIDTPRFRLLFEACQEIQPMLKRRLFNRFLHQSFLFPRFKPIYWKRTHNPDDSKRLQSFVILPEGGNNAMTAMNHDTHVASHEGEEICVEPKGKEKFLKRERKRERKRFKQQFMLNRQQRRLRMRQEKMQKDVDKLTDMLASISQPGSAEQMND